ncbi:MAG: CfrBI family restriction endonuclease [Bacteroidaceae bacterium]|nr:CfrBI family restriction endonuclease [Bacteroidaceae bacterium]
MGTFKNLIPKDSLNLVNYSGKELIDRLGGDIISNVVLSVLRGDNLRNLTEGLTQRRILLMNASLIVTYLKALQSYDDLVENINEIIAGEVQNKRLKLSKAEKQYLFWFLGLTGKSIQNVVRDSGGFSSYLSSLDRNLSQIADDVEKIYGRLDIQATLPDNGIHQMMNWPSLLRCMLALGAQTLSIRGSEKSMYGKLFEKFVLGSVLTILGGTYINREDTTKNIMVFWLSERQEKRESDATLLLRPGAGIRFDIGFIGKGNPEISLDKVTRFERIMERGGLTHNTTTIILIDTLGDNSRTESMARNIGGYIVQMSGTYWVYELASIIKKEFPFYNHPILSLKKEQSLAYLGKAMQKVDLSLFLSAIVENE